MGKGTFGFGDLGSGGYIFPTIHRFPARSGKISSGARREPSYAGLQPGGKVSPYSTKS